MSQIEKRSGKKLSSGQTAEEMLKDHLDKEVQDDYKMIRGPRPWEENDTTKQ